MFGVLGDKGLELGGGGGELVQEVAALANAVGGQCRIRVFRMILEELAEDGTSLGVLLRVREGLPLIKLSESSFGCSGAALRKAANPRAAKSQRFCSYNFSEVL